MIDQEARELEFMVEDYMRSCSGAGGTERARSDLKPESIVANVELCRNEHPSYISPSLNKRFRGVYEHKKKK